MVKPPLTVLFRHVPVGLLQLQWLTQVVLQQLELRVDGDPVVGPLEPNLLIVVGKALDVDRTDLDVHRVQLELHLAGDDRMHHTRVPDR